MPAHHPRRWLRGAHDTLAVRLTAHRQAALLCRGLNSALVSTSANRSGQRPARTYAQCRRLFERKVWVLPDAWASAKTFHDPALADGQSFAVKRKSRQASIPQPSRNICLNCKT
jgi:tRNA A37 threonylcarbamoyladenosine synthetase subunit TsaC/SUA5/YrdC